MSFRELFSLNRSDRLVLTVILCAATVFLVVMYVAERYVGPTNPMTADDSLAFARQQTDYRRYPRHQRKNYNYSQYEQQKRQLFPFDPNTADSTTLLRLGLKPWQVRNIYRYRAEGGVFRKPEDFAKLYGLTRKQYRQMEPYIHISEDYLDASTIYNYEPASERDTVKSPVKIKPLDRVVLNTADTSMLKKVPGIGSHFARKIVDYRRRLGGFYDIHQLLEIEDFPQTALVYFIIPNDSVRKININHASLNELKKHPYISFFQARAISDYRRLKGRISSLHELKLLKEFPPQAIERLEPYVAY